MDRAAPHPDTTDVVALRTRRLRRAGFPAALAECPVCREDHESLLAQVREPDSGTDPPLTIRR